MDWYPTKLDFLEWDLIVTYKNSKGETQKREEILRVNESTHRGFDNVRLDLIRQVRERYGYNVFITHNLYAELDRISEGICMVRGEEIPKRRKNRRARVPGSREWLRTKNKEQDEVDQMEFIRATW